MFSNIIIILTVFGKLGNNKKNELFLIILKEKVSNETTSIQFTHIFQ